MRLGQFFPGLESSPVQDLPRFCMRLEHSINKDQHYCLTRDITFGLFCVINEKHVTGVIYSTPFSLHLYSLMTKMVPHTIPLFEETRYPLVEHGFKKSIILRYHDVLDSLTYSIDPISKTQVFLSFLLAMDKIPSVAAKKVLPAMVLYCTI